MADTNEGELEAQEWMQNNASTQAEWYGDTEEYNPKGVYENESQSVSADPGFDVYSWYGDGDKSNPADVANYAFQTVSETTGASSDLINMIFNAGGKVGNYFGKAGDNLLDKIQKNPDEAMKFFAGMIGSALKNKSDREREEGKDQRLSEREREKEQRISASVPTYTSTVAPGLIGSAMKRTDGKNYFLANGQINRGA